MEPMRDDGFVYLVRPSGRNVYKIGETVNIENRMARKEKEVDYKLEVVCFVKVNHRWKTEHALHLLYERLRLAGEWFVLPESVVDNFEEIATRVSAQVDVFEEMLRKRLEEYNAENMAYVPSAQKFYERQEVKR